MANTFDQSKGEMAWGRGCPCCGDALKEFTDGDFPSWKFECFAEIYVDEDGNFVVWEDCPDAMQIHLEQVLIIGPEDSEPGVSSP